MPWKFIQTGELFTEQELRKRHPQTVFAANITDADVQEFGYVWEDPAPPTPPTLNEVQQSRWAVAKAQRDDLEASGFMYQGHPMDSDPRAVQRINTAVQAAQAALGAGQPFKLDWTCMDGHILPLDAAGMMGMPVALAMRANALHLHAKALKSSIMAAPTVDDVNAIDIENGWPAL